MTRTRSLRTLAGTALVDPDATKRVTEAAKAAGFRSVHELIDFIADAGLIGLPPADGITERYTLEDLGLRLWATMQARPIAKRAEWFHELAEQQQVSLVTVLRNRGFSCNNIARQFEIPERKVRQWWNKHADHLGAQVVGTRLNVIVGELQARAEQSIDELTRLGKPKEAFSVQKDFVGLLQNLGIVERAAQHVHHTHDVGEQTMQEIESLVAIREKKAAAQERVKSIDAEVIEEPPDGLLAPVEELDDEEDIAPEFS